LIPRGLKSKYRSQFSVCVLGLRNVHSSSQMTIQGSKPRKKGRKTGDRMPILRSTTLKEHVNNDHQSQDDPRSCGIAVQSLPNSPIQNIHQQVPPISTVSSVLTLFSGTSDLVGPSERLLLPTGHMLPANKSPTDGSTVSPGHNQVPPFSYNLLALSAVQTSVDTDSTHLRCEELIDVLQQNGCYETEDGMRRRQNLISEMDTLVKQWIRSISLSKRMNWQDAEQVGGKIVTYGSYRLGAVDCEADMDILCIAPNCIERDDFFCGQNSFMNQLRKRKDVTELRCLVDVYVPVIKMKFAEIDVDLTFASLANREIPEDESFFQNDSVTNNIDMRCLRSLNGYRATAEILDRLVPDVATFQITLRAVKLWAKKNGIYGNILGYLGGFSWTVLVAKVCQLYKGASSSELVIHFFRTFANWLWPEPVFLKAPGRQPYQAWNPHLNPQDKLHCMPIITPCTPQINSTNLVTRSTLKQINRRIHSGLQVCEEIARGQEPWSSLFRPPGFFQEHMDYLMVTAQCAGDHLIYFGLIESQLRHLRDNLERECGGTTGVWIWPRGFIRLEEMPIRKLWFIGLDMMPGHDINEIKSSLNTFKEQIATKMHQVTSEFWLSMTVTAHHIEKENIAQHLTPEEMEIPEKKKLSYAAVTQGQTAQQSTASVVTSHPEPTLSAAHNPTITSYPPCTNTTNTNAQCVSTSGPPPPANSPSYQPSSVTCTTQQPSVPASTINSQQCNSNSTSQTPSVGGISPSLVSTYPTNSSTYQSTASTLQTITTSTTTNYQTSGYINPAAHYPGQNFNANYLHQNYQHPFTNYQPPFNNYRQAQSPHRQSQPMGQPGRNNSPQPVIYSNPPHHGFSNKNNLSPNNYSNSRTSSPTGYTRSRNNSPNNYSLAPGNHSNKHNQSNNYTTTHFPIPSTLHNPPRNNSPIHGHASGVHSSSDRRNSPNPNSKHKNRINSPHSSQQQNRIPSPLPSLPNQTLPATNFPPPPLHRQRTDLTTPPPPLATSPHHVPPNNNHIKLNNHRLDCSCSSLSDVESQQGGNNRKDSCSDTEDRLRSVSYTSDKFPPVSLTRARLTHQEKGPMSPMWPVGLIPLTDTSVPPPTAPNTTHPPPTTTQQPPGAATNPRPSFSVIRPQRQRALRLSQSEIRDTPTPRPITQAFKQQNIRFSFSNADNEVFKN
jgi:poly(A) polymerase